MRERNPAAISFLGPNFITSEPKKRFTTAVDMKRMLSLKEYMLRSTPRFSVIGPIKRLFVELQNPRQVNTIRKQDAITTHL